MTDWRLQNQSSYLKGADLCFAVYQPYKEIWDHDHCEFCNGKFAAAGGDFTEGYKTMDSYHWICRQCFEDFKTEFDWKIK